MPAKQKSMFSQRFDGQLQKLKIPLVNRVIAEKLSDVLKPARRAKNALTEGEVARWRGTVTPSNKILGAMAAHFGVTSEYLLGATDKAGTDLGRKLAGYVEVQLDADPVFTPLVNQKTRKPVGRGARRTSYRADPVRLLRFVVAAARAAEQNDRDVERGERSTLFLYTALDEAADQLKKAGAGDAAADAKRAIKILDRAMAEQFTPKLLSLFDGAASDPMPAFRIGVVKPA